MGNEIGLRVEGLDEVIAAMDEAGGNLGDVVHDVEMELADRIVDGARGSVRSKSGAARGSIRSASKGPERVEISGGGSRAPYFGWLDFGGGVGVNDSVQRPYRRRGRYVWLEYFDLDDGGDVEQLMDDELVDVVERAGLDVAG